jgi:Iap family predicted aminopeptidase
VPGASDNATGVAAVIDLMRRFAADPPHRCEVLAVIPGAEESGMGGMRAWLRGAGARLDPRSTLVLGLDTLGAGEPVVLSAEGPPRGVRYRDEDLDWADRGADRAGLPRPPRVRLGGWTDPALAALAGLPAISLLSMRDGAFTNYHLPSDTPDRVDWDSVTACARIAEATARDWAQAPRTGTRS